MALFLIKMTRPINTRAGTDGFLVVADDATKARELVASLFLGDDDLKSTNVATADAFSTSAPADLTGFKFSLTLRPGGGGWVKYAVSYTAIALDDIDAVGVALAAALVAVGLTASYNAGTNVLTVAAIGDNIGTYILTAEARAPAGEQPIPSFFSTYVAQGIAAAAVKVTLVAPTAVPAVLLQFKQVL